MKISRSTRSLSGPLTWSRSFARQRSSELIEFLSSLRHARSASRGAPFRSGVVLSWTAF